MSIYTILHISFLSIGMFAALMTGVVAFLGKKGKGNWLMLHRVNALSAVSFSVAGLIFMIISKTTQNESHFQTIHAILGLIVVILLGLNLIGGTLMIKFKIKKMALMHRLFGGIIILSAICVFILGLIKFL